MSIELPVASPVQESTTTIVDFDSIVASLKSLEPTELFKLIKLAIAEAEKKSKNGDKTTKATTVTKKAGSMPKGVVPKQLRKPRAWVDFTLANALENGWESFTVYQTKKDKTTGEKIEEEIEMPASILHNGAHVYADSINAKFPNGKQLIHKDAMSLSKQRWAPKENTGTHPELYAEFEAQYEEEEEIVPETTTVTAPKVVVKMTAAEKAAAAEAKKLEKEQEKALKKAEKEAEKEAKKLAKEQEKAQKKAEKDAEKAAAKAAKQTTKKPTGNVVVPAAAVAQKKVVVKAAEPVVETPVESKPVKVVKKVVPAPKKEEWSCPADGMVHPWPYKGKQYFRNSDNEVWLKGPDGGCGDWQGIYLPAEDRIDDSVEEPVFEDEE